MPMIKVETNVALDAVRTVECVKKLSELAAEMLGKSEDYVLAILEDGKSLLFGGHDDPAAYVTLDSIGLQENDTPVFSAKICTFLEDELSIPAKRTYIAFGSIERHLFGWDGRTF